MKKVTRKVKQALSILLVAAMVITIVPQNTLAVSAEEAVETVNETVETTVTDETEETTSETENVDETGASDEDADAEESEEGEADEETEEDENLEDEEIVEEETEEGTRRGADGFEAMEAGVNTVEYDYTDAAVTITDDNDSHKTTAGTPYAFKVAAKNSYQIDSVKAYVDYVSETEPGDEVALTDKGNGNYEIGVVEVNKYEDKTIKVVIKASKITYNVTFDENPNVTVTIVKDAVESPLPDGRIVAVEKDGSVSFKVALTAAAEEAGKTLKSVKCGAEDVAESNSIYTLSGYTGAKTITITTEDPKKYALKFGQDRAEAKVVISNITQSGYSASINDVKLDNTDAKAAASNLVEKKDVTFTVGVADDSIYKVKSVTSSEGTVSAKNGVYTLKGVEGNEAVTVTVTTELDETRCNVLEFAVGEAGLEDSFTATVDTAGSYSAEDKKNKILYDAKADKNIVVTAASGYKITAIKLDGKTLETKHTEEDIKGEKEDAPVKIDGSGNWAFTVEYKAASNEKHTVTVCTDAEGLREEKTVTFFNNTAYLNLAVTTDDKIVRTKGDTYQVKEGATLLKFAITTSNNIYKPCFMLHSAGSLKESDIRLTGKVAGDKETTYNYTVTVNKIDADAAITISQMLAVDQYSVTVKYPTDDIASVKFIAEDGTELTPASDEQEGNTIAHVDRVIEGNKVKVVVKAKECYKIKEASTVVGDEDPKKSTVDATEYSYEVTATANTETTITTEALTKAVLLEGENIIAPNANGQYDVAYGDGKTYKAQVRLGATPQTLTDVKVLTDGAETTASNNTNAAAITLDAEDAGKEVKVQMTVGTGDAAKKYEVTLKLAAAPKEVSVAGVNKSGKLVQNVDTVKTYPITVKTANATKDLTVKVDGTGVDARINDGNVLEVTVANTAEAKADLATITLYDKNDKKQKNPLNGGTIKVTTTQLLNGVKPTVSVTRATDIDFILTVGSDVSKETLNKGALYYKIVVTPEDTSDAKIKTPDPIYLPRTAATDVTDKIVVSTEIMGKGKAAKFGVDVTLVQTKEGALSKENESSNIVFKTGTKSIKAETKAPYYTTKLSVKKMNGAKVYTGQRIAVGQVTYDKSTSYLNVTASSDSPKLTVTEENGTIYVEAKKEMPIGKYTIDVSSADTGNALYVAKTSFTIDVVRGIENLSATILPDSLYMTNKGASFKINPVYNWGSSYKDKVPKTKKVTYTITNSNGTELSAENAKLITVKNGQIKVDKKYVVKSDPVENRFKITVKAADFEGNDTKVSKNFEITNKAVELGNLIIAMPQYDQFYNIEGYEVVDTSSAVTADKLDGAKAFVLKPGVAKKDYYSDVALQRVLTDAQVTFKSGNKALAIKAHRGDIEVSRTAENVKITATATDGSGKTSSITLKEIKYAGAEDLSIRVFNPDTGKVILEHDNKEGSFYGAKDTVMYVYISPKINGVWNDSWYSITDAKVSIKGAKTLDTFGNIYHISATGTPITLRLQSKSMKIDKTYTISNLSIPETKTKAPSLKTTDKLYGGEYVVTPEEGYKQKVVYYLPKEYAGKFILITKDAVDKFNSKKKNNYRYDSFNPTGLSPAVSNDPQRIGADGSVTLEFNGTGDPCITNIPVGSYKLNYIVGSINDNGEFVAETKPGSVTLKAIAQKSVKAKLNTSYALSLKESKEVKFTLNNKKAVLTSVDNLKNANIKGTENEFINYFEIANVGGEYVLRLKDALSKADVEKIVADNGTNLTGWVTYTYADERGNEMGTADAQIKVSFKEKVQKYGLTNASVLSDATTVKVNAFTGKDTPVNVKYVLIKDANSNFIAVANNTDVITLNVVDVAKLAKSTVNMYIVPADSYYSYYIDEFDGKNGDALNELIKKYGTEVKTTITVNAKDKAKGKIAINKKDLAKTFKATKAEEYVLDGKTGYYIVTVPYTTTVQNAPTSFTTEIVNDVDKKLFNVTAANGMITVKLNKDELVSAVAAKTVKYSEPKKATKRSVSINLKAAGYETETVKLTLTLPEKAKTYDEVKADVKAALADVTVGVETSPELPTYKEANERYIADIIAPLVTLDSDVDYNAIMADGSLHEPTQNAEGSIRIAVSLKNKVAAAPAFAKVKNVDLTLGKVVTEFDDAGLLSRLNTFFGNYKATNATTSTSLMNAARTDATVKMDQYPNLRLVLKSFTKTPATVGNSGEIYIRYYLKDILINQSTKAKPVSIRIEALKNWDQTKYEITDAWTNESDELLADLVNMDKDAAEVAVKNWVTNLIDNPNISVVEIKNFTFTASSSNAKGSVAGTVVLKDASNAEAASPEVVLTAKEIEKRETAENTKTRVETAITNELTLSDKTTANDVLNFVKANIKNPDITADWSTNEGEEFKLTAPTLISAGSIVSA